jgi:hypothetical protein
MKQSFLFLTVVLLFFCATAMAQAPTCGLKNSTAIFVPSDYLTLTPPTNKGSSYVDSSFGCTVFRVTNGPVDFGDSNGVMHNYIMSPVNLDDTMMIVWQGFAGVAIASFPDGALLMLASDPSLNGLNTTTWWEPGNAHKIIFAGGKGNGSATGTKPQLMTYNIYKTTASGVVSSGSSSVTVADATGIVANASITIQGAGASRGVYRGKVGARYVSGTSIPLNRPTSTTTSSNPVVAIGYDTVQHDFTGTYTDLDVGGHGAISSSTCCIAMEGKLADGSWKIFAYDYTTDTVHTAVTLQGINPTGVTVNATTGSGKTGMVFAKASGTGDWKCGTAQAGACQFRVAGDSTVYTFQWYQTTGTIGGGALSTLTVASASGLINGIQIAIAGAGPAGAALTTTVSSFSETTVTLATPASQAVTNAAVQIGHAGYDQTDPSRINAGTTSILSFAPALTQTENAAAAITLLWRSSGPAIVGNGYISTQTSDIGSSYDLYDINMNYVNTPTTFWQQGSHNDQNIDPANGHPTIYSVAGAASGTNSCGKVNGVEKIDMITSAKVCLQGPISFNLSPHFSTTANGQWLFIELADFGAGTACLNSCLPGNWASLWAYAYNEIYMINVDTKDIYRLAHHYSRVGGGPSYWSQPRAAISYDGNWGIWDSNFDQSRLLSGNSSYTDVYAVKTGIR